MIVLNQIDVSAVHTIGTIASGFIVLGFISTRLSKLREDSYGSYYEVIYLVVIGLFGITASCVNNTIHWSSLLNPFVEMFRMVSVILILIYLITKTKSFKATVCGNVSRKSIFGLFLIFSILGIVSSYFTLDVNGIPANARNLVVMISALFGGPFVGIPVGIVSGVWRYFLGGPTDLPCAVSTIVAGFVGGLIYRWSAGRYLNAFNGALLMFLYSGFDMYIVSLLTPGGEGIVIVSTLYAPMTFMSMLGIVLFSMFLTEKKVESSKLQRDILENKENISINSDIIDAHSERIIELSMELKEYKNKINELEQIIKDKNNEK